MSTDFSLADRVRQLIEAESDPNRDYYALTLLLGENGRPEYTCFSGWVGFTDDVPRREIREASLVNADRMVAGWRTLEEAGMVVNTADDFALFFGYGGHAVVEKTLAEFVVPEWLAPSVVVPVGPLGFAAPGTLPAGAMQRAPTPKHRMKIIKRDTYRCRVCGRSPNTNTDIELHVHHVRPWALGGVTEDSNLMTLCHTCHTGLEPHYEYSLFGLLKEKETSERGARYQRRLAEYQAAVAAEGASGNV